MRGFEAGNRARVVSNHQQQFITNVIILQPGDRISVNYFTVVRNADFEGGYKLPDPSENLKPVIQAQPFSVGPTYDFTEWMMEYLPK